MAKTKKKTKKKTKGSKKPLASGKFGPGNKAGSKSKSPSAKTKLQMAEAFKKAISLQDIKDIAKTLVTEAKAGNAKAAKEVLDRCLGKPAQPLNIAGEDGGPLPPITVIIQHAEAQS